MTNVSRFLSRLTKTAWPTPWSGLFAALFVLSSLALVALPVIPQVLGSGKHQDYQLWFVVGQRMLRGGPLQEIDNGVFDFLYTPFAGLLLAIPAYFGKTAMVVMLSCLNLLAWWVAIALSNRLSGDDRPVAPWVAAAPVIVTLPFVYDQFHIGQPNLLLLALALCGFCLLRRDRGWLAGLPFAAAGAIKVFPMLILPWLLWRGYWRTTLSMVALLIVFLVVVPGAIRGFDRNWSELGGWVSGMLPSGGDREFGQRADLWGWKNQSLYAVEHRLLRPIDAEIDPDEAEPPTFVNLLDLDPRTVDAVVLATALAIGTGFVLLMPARRRRTRQSDAAEWSILALLVVIASPVARSYYYVWMLLPYVVLVRSAAGEPDRRVARWQVFAVALSVVLLAAGINGIRPHWTQAAGVFLWSAVVVIAALASLMRRSAAVAPAATAPTVAPP
ncbi:MAG: glycosyltransferase family 87 protein [Xanthobacteraceae bacterium]|nr:glycosyltransferase family 87 protein [Xanthobacteraceae bacterium]